ncbi:hypothetical protein, partial [Victivallis vadensis]|uniref:hypothetical protein n=1 Tax=Victivallis vadensis TaxID=172901 RepID=UPI003CFF9654
AENGKTTQSYSYDISGRLATADYGDSRETFLWDGLALLSRNNLKYVNEPAVTGGNPILAGDKILFDDMLGNTLGVKDGEKFSAIDRDAFGELKPGEKPNLSVNFFTGKPEIDGLGYSFLLRNYRADLGKWQTTDPLGYPDGWNNLAYVNNGVTMAIDWMGGEVKYTWSGWSVQRTIGVSGETVSTGVQGGNSVVILWTGTISWKCNKCNKSGSETYYATTTYTASAADADYPLWTAPSTNVKKYTGGEIVEALGITNDAVDTVIDLVDRAIATNLSQATVDHKAYNSKPARPTNPKHVCE